jgi:hypothetical protein
MKSLKTSVVQGSNMFKPHHLQSAAIPYLKQVRHQSLVFHLNLRLELFLGQTVSFNRFRESGPGTSLCRHSYFSSGHITSRNGDKLQVPRTIYYLLAAKNGHRSSSKTRNLLSFVPLYLQTFCSFLIMLHCILWTASPSQRRCNIGLTSAPT